MHGEAAHGQGIAVPEPALVDFADIVGGAAGLVQLVAVPPGLVDVAVAVLVQPVADLRLARVQVRVVVVAVTFVLGLAVAVAVVVERVDDLDRDAVATDEAVLVLGQKGEVVDALDEANTHAGVPGCVGAAGPEVSLDVAVPGQVQVCGGREVVTDLPLAHDGVRGPVLVVGRGCQNHHGRDRVVHDLDHGCGLTGVSVIVEDDQADGGLADVQGSEHVLGVHADRAVGLRRSLPEHAVTTADDAGLKRVPGLLGVGRGADHLHALGPLVLLAARRPDEGDHRVPGAVAVADVDRDGLLGGLVGLVQRGEGDGVRTHRELGDGQHHDAVDVRRRLAQQAVQARGPRDKERLRALLVVGRLADQLQELVREDHVAIVGGRDLHAGRRVVDAHSVVRTGREQGQKKGAPAHGVLQG